LSEEIGTRRRNWHTSGADQRACHFMSWEPHPNAWEACANQFRDCLGCWGDDRERPWPEGVRECAHARITERTGSEDAREFRAIGNVDDQRVKRWSTLRRKDPRNGDRIRCVSAETIDRLRWEGDKFPVTKQRGSAWDRSCDLIRVAGVEQLRLDCFHHPALTVSVIGA
jgi:hypothetical protein